MLLFTLAFNNVHLYAFTLTNVHFAIQRTDYSKISATRLSELLNQTPAATEAALCEMVTDGQLYARIDRLAGVVCFKKAPNDDETLNE
jgi:hypothetical protein